MLKQEEKFPFLLKLFETDPAEKTSMVAVSSTRYPIFRDGQT